MASELCELTLSLPSSFFFLLFLIPLQKFFLGGVNTNVCLARQTSLQKLLDLTIPLSWSQRNLSRRTAEVNSVDLCVTTGNTKASGLSLKMEQKSSSFSQPTECKRAWFPEDLWLTFLCHSRHRHVPPRWLSDATKSSCPNYCALGFCSDLSEVGHTDENTIPGVWLDTGGRGHDVLHFTKYKKRIIQ